MHPFKVLAQGLTFSPNEAEKGGGIYGFGGYAAIGFNPPAQIRRLPGAQPVTARTAPKKVQHGTL